MINKAINYKHRGFIKYFQTFSWVVLVNILNTILNFFVGIYVARGLGPTDFGTFNFIVSFFTIAGINLIVIDQLLLKKLNKEEVNKEGILGTAFLIKFLASILSIIIAVSISFLLNAEIFTIFLIFLFSTTSLFSPFGIIRKYFQSIPNISEISKYEILTKIIFALLRISMIYFGFGIIGIISSYVIHMIINVSSLIYVYIKRIGSLFKWTFSKEHFIYFLKNSLPFTISLLAISVYLRIDQIFIKLFLGSESVGSYAVSVKFTETFMIFATLICTSLLPAILNSHKENIVSYKNRTKLLFSFLTYSSLILSSVLFFIGPILIKLFYGAEYVQSIDVFKIYVWILIGHFIFTGLQQFLLTEEKFKTILFINLLMMTTSLITNFFLIQKFGNIGAGYANIITYSIPILFILISPNIKSIRIDFLKGIFKPIKL